MSKILVTGPTRSGKSEWAETLAKSTEKSVIYVATALRDDQDREWQERILRHQQRRPPDWQTREVPIELGQLLEEAQAEECLLIDSLGTWLANVLDQEEEAWLSMQGMFLEGLQRCRGDVILVAEETGWGVVPPYAVGRRFRDRLGSLIRVVAAIANPTYLVTAGYALNLTYLGIPLVGDHPQELGLR